VPRSNEAFEEELSHYKGGKGTAQFPLDLIIRIVKFKEIEVAGKPDKKR
jgi:hypothetical protein